MMGPYVNTTLLAVASWLATLLIFTGNLILFVNQMLPTGTGKCTQA